MKNKLDGSVDRYRARLVARSLFQRSGYDYGEIFSLVARYISIRVLLAIAVAEGLLSDQFDIQTAFLYGDVDTEIYMVQPEDSDDGSGRVCRLFISLYDLKQSSRKKNERFDKFMKKIGFIRLKTDPCIYIHNCGLKKLIVAGVGENPFF